MSDNDNGDEPQRGGSVKEILAPEKLRIKPPPLYRVILLNDDYTPMEFVVEVLRRFFGMEVETATRVMLKVHTEGKGVCGVYPREIAETKAVEVNEFARTAEHPLLCDIEVDD
jgi:ATP-dependent Clp protease adaptor protein ClpS